MTPEEVWDHLDTHQNDSAQQIAEDCSLPLGMTRQLIAQWALRNKPMFEELFFTHEVDVIVDEDTGQRVVTVSPISSEVET